MSPEEFEARFQRMMTATGEQLVQFGAGMVKLVEEVGVVKIQVRELALGAQQAEQRLRNHVDKTVAIAVEEMKQQRDSHNPALDSPAVRFILFAIRDWGMNTATGEVCAMPMVQDGHLFLVVCIPLLLEILSKRSQSIKTQYGLNIGPTRMHLASLNPVPITPAAHATIYKRFAIQTYSNKNTQRDALLAFRAESFRKYFDDMEARDYCSPLPDTDVPDYSVIGGRSKACPAAATDAEALEGRLSWGHPASREFLKTVAYEQFYKRSPEDPPIHFSGFSLDNDSPRPLKGVDLVLGADMSDEDDEDDEDGEDGEDGEKEELSSPKRAREDDEELSSTKRTRGEEKVDKEKDELLPLDKVQDLLEHGIDDDTLTENQACTLVVSNLPVKQPLAESTKNKREEDDEDKVLHTKIKKVRFEETDMNDDSDDSDVETEDDSSDEE